VTEPVDGPIILFDGVCHLCNGTVRFVLARDRAGRFRFATLQSAAAHRLLASHGGASAVPDSVVLLGGGRLLTRSDAILAVAAGLGWPWAALGAARVVPRGLRDAVYDLVARHRYRWFGRREVCMVPGPEVRARFLE
jgi:predicted DCC family thiol-disulfide oxidoreductase YuxK